MLLVDDLLLSPVTSLLWLFREIHKAVQQEQAGEAEAVTRALSELYMQLETGSITEAEFAAREKQLLDRLEAVQARDEEEEDGDGQPDEEEGEEGDDEMSEGNGSAGAEGAER